MRRPRLILAAMATTLAAAAGAQGQAPTMTITRSASPGSVGAVTGWDNEANAAGGITGGCFAGGDSCRTNTCAADAPTSFPTSQRQTLWATAFSAWTPPSGYTVSAVRVDAYGSRTNSQTARWQLRIRGPVSDTTGERQTTAPCDWIFDRSSTGGSWNVTNALGRPWTVADVNNLDVGVDYFTSAALSNDSFWISGIRQEITVDCAPFTASISANGPTQLCPGGSVTFTAQGTPDPRVINPTATYQWRLNGVDISGQTNQTLTVLYGAQGTYTCVVSFGCNPRLAENAFTVTPRPAATVGPPSANPNPVCSNGTSTLSVNIGGEAPLTVQWYRDGAAFGAPIAGLNPGTVTLNVPGSAANANFTAQVTQSGCGPSAVSSPVFLGQLILAGASSISPSGNSTVCPGGVVPLSVTISGSAPLTLQWQRSGSGNYGPPQTGLSPGTYTINVPYTDGDATFSAQVSNACNVAGSPNAAQISKLLIVSATPLTSTSGALCAGESASVCTTLSGSPPFTVQWLRDGLNFGSPIVVPAPGQVCLLVNHASANASFSARVSNTCNTLTTNAVTIAARSPASLGSISSSAPSLCPGGSATLSVLVSGTAPVTVQWLRNGAPYQPAVEVSPTPSTISLSVPYTDAGATFSARATNVCSTTPVTTPNGVTINQNTVAGISPISLTGPSALCTGETTQVSVTINGTAPLTLQWRRNGAAFGPPLTGLSPGTYSCTIAFADAPAAFSACVTNVCTTTPLCTTNSVTIVANQPAQVTTPSVPTAICPGQASTTCVVLSGTPPFTLQWRRNGEPYGVPIPGLPEGIACLNIPYADANATFSACVTNICSTIPVCSSGTFAPINLPATATNLRLVSSSSALCSGQSATIAVDVGGTTPITLQWRKNGANFGPPQFIAAPGTVTRNIPWADAPGAFSACVTNICTTTPACTSNSIALSRASEVTSIAINPSAPSACLGGPVTLTATAAPAGSFTYQWFRNTLPIPGATGATYTIPSARVRDAARYTVAATATCNSLTSQPVDLTVLEHPVWTPLEAPQPVARFGAAMAYDPVRNVTVLFGGQTNTGFRNDTWEWNGEAWALRNPATPPSVRAFSAMAYDRVRNVMVLVGGRNANGPIGETWEYTGTAWVQQPGLSPTPRDRAGMVWDSANNRMVLYGGFGVFNTLGDTWFRTGQTWTDPALAGPAPRTAWNALAYDSDRNVAVMFGGDTTGPNNETWEFAANTWTLRANGGPATRFHHALVYDRSRSRTVLLGGWDGSSIRPTMWEWDGAAWASRPLFGPDPRRDAAMVFDEAREALTLFGGVSIAGTVADTWRQRPFGRADLVSIGQIPFPDGLVTGDDFIGFINAFASASPIADLVGIGGTSPPDGFITGDDFIAFINTFTFGCP